MVVAALLMGLLAWSLMLISKDAFPHIGLDSEMENRIRANRHDEIAWAKERELRWEFYWQRSLLNYTYIGAALGLAWGAVSGFAGRNTLKGVALGVVLGVIGAAAGAFVTAQVTLATDSVGMVDEIRTVYDPLVRSLMMHSGAFAMIGLAGGLIVALANRRSNGPVRLAVSGLASGVLGTVVFELTAATLFQMERTDLPVPDGDMNKLAFAVLPGLVITLGLWRAASVAQTAVAPAAAIEPQSTDNV